MKSHPPLEKRLANYALSAGTVLAMSANSQAAVVYTPGPGVISLPYAIDIDGVNGPEFIIEGAQSGTAPGSYSKVGLFNYPGKGNGADVSSFSTPRMLNFVEGFGPGVYLGTQYAMRMPQMSQTWYPRFGANLFDVSGSIVPPKPGPFAGAGEKYIGAFLYLDPPFTSPATFHHGWIKVDISNQGQVTLLGYAYETANYSAINTGDGDVPLPVELSAFTAVNENNAIKLSWSTESEKDNIGFILERCLAGKLKWQEIASYKSNNELKGHNTSTSKANYTFTDNDIVSGETYQYRLSQENIDGTITVNKIISVTVESTPTNFALKQNYPNPFNPTTTIEFSLKETRNVNLSVYNMSGQLIETLINGELNAGVHSTEWNATNVPAGTYFYQLQSGEYKEIEKAVLVK